MNSHFSGFRQQATSYGGRGLFSTQPIPKDTLLLSCHPYASVISRVFRKEVCGHCFAYAFDANRNAWNIKYEAGHGIWFCSETCREAWVRTFTVDGLLGQLYIAIEKEARKTKEPADSNIHPSEEITIEVLDHAWTNAETRSSDELYIDTSELDSVRFVLSAILTRYIEDTSRPKLPETFTWSELLQLQNNELVHLRTHPHILPSYLRIYAFVRRVVSPFPMLKHYVDISDTVRAVLVRDPGNVFGMWDMSTSGDSEMLGWCMYISASYFNHDCAPNVRKQRVGRAMLFYTTRDVDVEEELCINYVDLEDNVRERQKQLLDNWYFACACQRCTHELAVSIAGVGQEALDIA